MAKKILIVDDEAHIVEMVKARLKANDYDIVTASNGEEALSAARENTPDLILLDVVMPVMDGWTCVREKKKDPAIKDIPVIMLTGKEALKDMFELEGVKDYIVKPFESDELLAKIEACLSKNTT